MKAYEGAGYSLYSHNSSREGEDSFWWTKPQRCRSSGHRYYLISISVPGDFISVTMLTSAVTELKHESTQVIYHRSDRRQDVSMKIGACAYFPGILDEMSEGES